MQTKKSKLKLTRCFQFYTSRIDNSLESVTYTYHVVNLSVIFFCINAKQCVYLTHVFPILGPVRDVISISRAARGFIVSAPRVDLLKFNFIPQKYWLLLLKYFTVGGARCGVFAIRCWSKALILSLKCVTIFHIHNNILQFMYFLTCNTWYGNEHLNYIFS